MVGVTALLTHIYSSEYVIGIQRMVYNDYRSLQIFPSCSKERIRFQFKTPLNIFQEYHQSIENVVHVFTFPISQRCTLIFTISSEEFFLQILKTIIKAVDITVKFKTKPCVTMQDYFKARCSVPEGVASKQFIYNW